MLEHNVFTGGHGYFMNDSVNWGVDSNGAYLTYYQDNAILVIGSPLTTHKLGGVQSLK